MTKFLANLSLEKVLNSAIKLFLLVLPFQTAWIYREVIINGGKWQYGTLEFLATEVLLWAVLFLFFGWYVKKYKNKVDKQVRFSKDRIFTFTCLLFVFYVFISAWWAADQSLATDVSLKLMEAILFFFVVLLAPISLSSMTTWFIGGAIFQAILGSWQFLTQSTFSSVYLGMPAHPVSEPGTSILESQEIGRWLRAYGGLSHPNILGGYLSLSLFFLLGFKNKFSSNKLLFSGSLIVLISGLFFSFSRSAWIVSLFILFSWLVYIFVKKHRQNLLYPIVSSLFIIAGLVAAFYPLVELRLGGGSVAEARSVEKRLDGYESAASVIENNVWFGTGAGNYTAALINQDPNHPGWFYQPVHNIFVLALAEFGVVGFLLILAMVVSLIYFWFSSTIFTKYKLVLLTQLVVAILVLGALDHYLLSSFVGLISLSLIVSATVRETMQNRRKYI